MRPFKIIIFMKKIFVINKDRDSYYFWLNEYTPYNRKFPKGANWWFIVYKWTQKKNIILLFWSWWIYEKWIWYTALYSAVHNNVSHMMFKGTVSVIFSDPMDNIFHILIR